MIYSIDVLMIFNVATHRMATSKSLFDVDFELVLRHHHAEIAVALSALFLDLLTFLLEVALTEVVFSHTFQFSIAVRAFDGLTKFVTLHFNSP